MRGFTSLGASVRSRASTNPSRVLLRSRGRSASRSTASRRPSLFMRSTPANRRSDASRMVCTNHAPSAWRHRRSSAAQRTGREVWMPASCSGQPGAPPGTAQPRLARLVELTEHTEWLPQSPCTNGSATSASSAPSTRACPSFGAFRCPTSSSRSRRHSRSTPMRSWTICAA